MKESTVGRSLTYQLSSLAEDAIGSAETLFRGRFGLDVHAFRVLRLIDNQPGVTFTELARRTKFERSATSRILSRLIREGLVRRRIKSEDARQFELFSTAKGRALRERADPITVELEALLLSPLSEAERKQFLTILRSLNAWVGTGYLTELQRRFPDARGGATRKAR